jgi:uncharacterized protein (DUF433 family)
MNYKDRITADPNIMLGKPIIKGTRITVDLILKKLSGGFTIEDLLKDYPHITREDVLAAIGYASEVVAHEEMIRV